MELSGPGFAFAAGAVVQLVDQLGFQFTAPVMVTYGKFIGADPQTVALFMTVRGIMSICSNIMFALLSDKLGQKIVVVGSTLGCALGYVLQAYAGNLAYETLENGDTSMKEDTSAAITTFMVGQAVSGLFSGINPVISAFVSEISGKDDKLMTWRLVTLGVARQSAGIALSPIAGAVASIQMQLPFWFSAGAALFGFVWAALFFPNEATVKRFAREANGEAPLAVADSKAEDVAKAAVADVEPERPEPSVLCDPVILLISTGFMFIFLPIQAMQFLIPLQLSTEDYAEITHNADPGEISKIVGLLAIPQGFTSIFVQMFLFMPLIYRCGYSVTLMIGFIVMTLATLFYGFAITQVWEMAVNAGLMGLAVGLITPSTGPIIAKYSGIMFPKQRAKAMAMPMIFMNISKSFAANLLATVVGPNDHFAAAWLLGAGCVVVCGVFITSGRVVSDSRLAKVESEKHEALQLKLASGELSEERRKLAGGERPEVFFESLVQDLRRDFEEQKGLLWNGPAQSVYRANVLSAMPKLQGLGDWNDENGGAEYLEGLFSLLPSQSEERLKLLAMFPNLDQKWHRSRRSVWVGGDAGIVATAPVILAQGHMPRLRSNFAALREVDNTSMQPINRHLTEPLAKSRQF